jgi:hypothetical protein
MLIAQKQSSRLTGLLPFAMVLAMVFIMVAGLFGASGFVYAADRAVVGELWSADN